MNLLTKTRKAIYRARGHLNGQLHGERFRLDPYHSRFWRRACAGAWEPETFAALAAHLRADRDYLDIGAWIGPTVLFGARKARHVWCLEPDPTAFRALVWNVELNRLDNVTPLCAALAGRTGLSRISSFGGERGDSMSSLLAPADAPGWDVLTLDWDSFATSTDLSGVALVKIDIEGAEFDLIPRLLPWLRRQRPALLLSTHAPYLPEEERRRRMADLAGALAFYPDRMGLGTGSTEMLSEAALRGFPTYLFSDPSTGK